MISLYAAKFTRPFDSLLFQELLNHISSERRGKIARFYQWRDAHRSLIAELLLRSVLIDNLGISNDEIAFGYTAEGKLFLRDFQDIHFNLSHSGSWVLCGYGSSPLGVDVEEIKDIDLDEAGDFLSMDERGYLLTFPCELQLRRFYKLWTLKESYAKALGEGFRISPDSFSIQLNDPGDIAVTQYGTVREYVHFRSGLLDDSHQMAVCSFAERSLDPIKILRIDEIIRPFISEPVYA